MEKNFADLSAYFNEQLKRSAEMITESGKFSFALKKKSYANVLFRILQ